MSEYSEAEDDFEKEVIEKSPRESPKVEEPQMTVEQPS